MFLIGIAGGSGSGKTTFAQKIVRHVENSVGGGVLAHLHQDCYYLPRVPEELNVGGKPNFDHPQAFDWDLLRTHLTNLRDGRSVDIPVYNFVTSTRESQTTLMTSPKACLFDGIYALWNEEIRKLMDVRVFLNVDADIRFIRRLHRDVKERGRNLDSIIGQYYDTVRPMYRQFLETTRQFADLTIGEESDIAAHIVASRILDYLSSS